VPRRNRRHRRGNNSSRNASRIAHTRNRTTRTRRKGLSASLISWRCAPYSVAVVIIVVRLEQWRGAGRASALCEHQGG
jgi:hypothetical protein